MKIRILLAILCFINIGNISAQDIEVKKFEPLEKDQTAALSPRKDINGVVCGLVKVLLKEPGAEFEGSVMGDVQFTGSEYLVWLPNGTKRLGIKHPDYLPTTIVFADYGVKKVESAVTYELKVKANKKKAKVDTSKKGMAVFNIKPSNAMLLIDGQIADGSGGAYTLSLPFGTHYYTVKLKDFSLNNQSIVIDKNVKTIDVDLSEYFAQVEVSCETRDADIYINGNLIGSGRVSEFVIPGKCVVEVRKDGFHSLSKTLELGDNEIYKVNFEKMTVITGKLQVKTDVQGAKVYLDGEMVGTTSMTKDIPIGDYVLEIKHDYYRPIKRTIDIGEDQNLIIDEELVLTQFGKIIMSANQDDDLGMCLLTSLYLYGSDNALKEGYWGSDHWGMFEGEEGEPPIYFVSPDIFIQENTKIESDIEKAYYWCEKRKALPEEKKQPFRTGSEWYHFKYELYIRFLTGDGVKQDYNKAFCLSEDFDFWQAWHYFNGKGVQKDTNKALKIFNERFLPSTVSPYDKDPAYYYAELRREVFLKEAKKCAERNTYWWDKRLMDFLESRDY